MQLELFKGKRQLQGYRGKVLKKKKNKVTHIDVKHTQSDSSYSQAESR